MEKFEENWFTEQSTDDVFRVSDIEEFLNLDFG